MVDLSTSYHVLPFPAISYHPVCDGDGGGMIPTFGQRGPAMGGQGDFVLSRRGGRLANDGGGGDEPSPINISAPNNSNAFGVQMACRVLRHVGIRLLSPSFVSQTHHLHATAAVLRVNQQGRALWRAPHRRALLGQAHKKVRECRGGGGGKRAGRKCHAPPCPQCPSCHADHAHNDLFTNFKINPFSQNQNQNLCTKIFLSNSK